MKTIALSLMTFVIAATGMAQTTETTKKEKQTPEQRTEKYVTVMQRETGIDDTQKQKVYDLRIEKVKKIKEIREKNAGDKEKMKTEAKPVVKEYNTALKGILNETQWEKWKSFRKAERVRMKAAIEKRKAAKNSKAKENPLEDDDYMDSLEDEE